MKLSTAMLVSTLILSLALWYAYWWSAGEAPAPEETTLIVGVAALLSAGALAVHRRIRGTGGQSDARPGS